MVFEIMEDIKRKCIPTVDLSKFTFNKKILSGVVDLIYNKVCCQTLLKVHLCWA